MNVYSVVEEVIADLDYELDVAVELAVIGLVHRKVSDYGVNPDDSGAVRAIASLAICTAIELVFDARP